MIHQYQPLSTDIYHYKLILTSLSQYGRYYSGSWYGWWWLMMTMVLYHINHYRLLLSYSIIDSILDPLIIIDNIDHQLSWSATIINSIFSNIVPHHWPSTKAAPAQLATKFDQLWGSSPAMLRGAMASQVYQPGIRSPPWGCLPLVISCYELLWVVISCYELLWVVMNIHWLGILVSSTA